MTYSVRTTDLQKMDAGEREHMLSELVRHATAPRNGQASILNAKIRAFEERYEMSSEELVEALRSARLRETADISRWLFWLEARAGRAG